jgi:hypothetical protein
MVLAMTQFQLCRASLSIRSISTPELQLTQQSPRPTPTHRPYVGRGNSSCCLIDSQAFGSPQMTFSEFPEWYSLLRRTVGLATAIRDIRCRAACRQRARDVVVSIFRWTRIEHHWFRQSKRASLICFNRLWRAAPVGVRYPIMPYIRSRLTI